VDDLLRDPVRHQHARPAEDLIPSRSLRLIATAAAVAAIGAGCDGDEPDNAAIGAAAQGAPSATLEWAVADRVRTVDPLYATTASELLAARQLHEPLVEQLDAPFDVARRSPGLALAVTPSADGTVWRARLRTGVRFQDGTPFNATAVLANVDRWRTVAAGRDQLGELLVDAPRPDLVRFILPAPDPDFPARLASPRLGIVSPRAIGAAVGGPVDTSRLPASGTGPFELRERSSDRALLAHNTGWWGTDRELGPGVDQIELRVVADPDERVAALRDGSVRVADLGRGQVRAVGSDPLLTAQASDGGVLGLERSVRGIPVGEPVPPLNAVWLTGIDSG
jgi:peptide/nickel transport system substrate-binding protein